MYRKILVPLDGSPSAEVALPRALELAARTGATLHVVTVAEGEVEGGVRRKSGDSPSVSVDRSEVVRAAEDYLEGVGRRIAEHARSVEVTGQVLPAGNLVSTLLNEMTAEDVDLAVMTTHGRGPHAEAWLGSVADGMARSSRRPLLLVRAPVEGSPHGDGDPLDVEAPPFRNVLVPLDGSLDAEEVLPHVRELARTEDARVTLLSVVALPSTEREAYGAGAASRGQVDPETILAASREALEETASALRAEGLAVDAEVRRHAHPASAILEVAAGGDTDLVAMTTRGRGGVPRLILGRVVDKVVRGAGVPVLLHRPRRRDEE